MLEPTICLSNRSVALSRHLFGRGSFHRRCAWHTLACTNTHTHKQRNRQSNLERCHRLYSMEDAPTDAQNIQYCVYINALGKSEFGLVIPRTRRTMVSPLLHICIPPPQHVQLNKINGAQCDFLFFRQSI